MTGCHVTQNANGQLTLLPARGAPLTGISLDAQLLTASVKHLRWRMPNSNKIKGHQVFRIKFRITTPAVAGRFKLRLSQMN